MIESFYANYLKKPTGLCSFPLLTLLSYLLLYHEKHCSAADKSITLSLVDISVITRNLYFSSKILSTARFPPHTLVWWSIRTQNKIWPKGPKNQKPKPKTRNRNSSVTFVLDEIFIKKKWKKWKKVKKNKNLGFEKCEKARNTVKKKESGPWPTHWRYRVGLLALTDCCVWGNKYFRPMDPV